MNYRAEEPEVPMIFDLRTAAAYIEGMEFTPSPEWVEDLGCRVGRDNYPGIVLHLMWADKLTRQAAARCVPAAWSSAEHPQSELHDLWWGALFLRAGYTTTEDSRSQRAERPTEHKILYRGATFSHRRNWSWTDRREVAEGFAFATGARRQQGQVWTAKVKPERLLAYINAREEREYVVDTKGLVIRQVAC